MLTLLDSLSLPGNPAKQNEDSFGHIANAALVMDGATGLCDPLMPGKSDAAWLATFGARRIMAYARDGASAREAVTAALFDAQTSYEALRKRAPVATYEIPFASMMLIVLNATGFEAAWFGDCAGLVKRPDAPLEVLGVAFEARGLESSRVAKLAKARGLNPAGDINRPEFLEPLRKARNLVNTDKGHYLFGPNTIAADHVASRQVDAPAGTKVLLASDGFLALASDYGRYDAEGLIAAAQAKGLKSLGEELRGIEAGDPEGIAYPRFKTSDDATAVLVELGG
jgi:hypothetical protein